MRATLTRSSPLLARPANSSISLGGRPAASTRTGSSISSGIRAQASRRLAGGLGDAPPGHCGERDAEGDEHHAGHHVEHDPGREREVVLNVGEDLLGPRSGALGERLARPAARVAECVGYPLGAGRRDTSALQRRFDLRRVLRDEDGAQHRHPHAGTEIAHSLGDTVTSP